MINIMTYAEVILRIAQIKASYQEPLSKDMVKCLNYMEEEAVNHYMETNELKRSKGETE